MNLKGGTSHGLTVWVGAVKEGKKSALGISALKFGAKHTASSLPQFPHLRCMQYFGIHGRKTQL